MQPADTTTTIFQQKKLVFSKMSFFTYSSFDELVYPVPLSNEVMLDEELDDTALPAVTAL